MHLSAKKQRDLTFLEVQAQQMVNEEIDEDNDFAGGTCLRDETKLEELLASKKERRTVYLTDSITNCIGRDPLRFLRETGQRADERGPRPASSEHFA